MGKLSAEIQRLAMQQREFLIKVLEACVTLKTHVETDLQNGWTHFPEISDARETLGKAKASLQASDTPSDIYTLQSHLIMEKQRLQSKYQEMMLQCQLDDLIGNSGVVFDFTLMKQALASIHSGEPVLLQPPGNGRISNHLAAAHNPILFLANYCMSQLYSRHIVSKQHLQNGSVDYHTNVIPVQTPPGSIHIHPVSLTQQQMPSQPQQHQTQLLIPPRSPSMKQVPSSIPQQNSIIQSQQNVFIQDNSPGGASVVGSLSVHSSTSNNSINLIRGPTNPYPMYYFNIEVNGTPHGRIVIEVRPDVAPKMSKNFSVLATGEIGVGYKGCSIFQCWDGESVITGDFELNNGRGGRSIYEDGYFMPDDTKFPAVRGAVGMRRTQKRHDNFGMVGSQFRIILQEMRGFTGIFGHVIEGLELVEKISTYGDQAGKPTKTIVITRCGKL